MKRALLAVGNKVELLLAQHINGLKHRKSPVYGVITYIDGAYIDVRPMRCSWVVEQYPSELKKK